MDHYYVIPAIVGLFALVMLARTIRADRRAARRKELEFKFSTGQITDEEMDELAAMK